MFTIIIIWYHSLLLKYLSDSSLRESSADCLHEIISKGKFLCVLAGRDDANTFAGMEPVPKTKLIESLYEVLESLGVLSPENVKVCCVHPVAHESVLKDSASVSLARCDVFGL